MVGHLLVERGITKYGRSTHFLKKECDVLVLLEPEFMRSHYSRKMSTEFVHSGQNNDILDRGTDSAEGSVVMPVGM